MRRITINAALSLVLFAASAASSQATERDGQTSRPRHTYYQVPAGIHLEIELQTNLSSNSSAVGDPVDARLRWPLTAEGVELVPAGATLLGSVSEVEPAGKKKRGRLVFAFHTIEHPETGSRAMIKSAGLAFASDLPKKGNVYPELKLEKGTEQLLTSRSRARRIADTRIRGTLWNNRMSNASRARPSRNLV